MAGYYSWVLEFVSRGQPEGGDPAAQLLDAAIEASAGAEAGGRESIDGKARQRQAEGPVARRKPLQHHEEGKPAVAPLVVRIADLLNVNVVHAVRLCDGERAAPFGDKRRSDLGPAVAQDAPGEGADGSSGGIVGRHAPDKVEQEILPHVLSGFRGQAETPAHPRSRGVSFFQEKRLFGGREAGGHVRWSPSAFR